MLVALNYRCTKRTERTRNKVAINDILVSLTQIFNRAVDSLVSEPKFQMYSELDYFSSNETSYRGII